MRPLLPWFTLGVVILVALAVPGSSAVRNTRGPVGETERDSAMRWAAFEMDDLAGERAQSGQPYLPFVRVPTLHAGLYELPAGAEDLQRPHDDDEIYYVAKGRAMVRVDGEEVVVQPGTVLFVKAGVEHRFHSITEDLSIVVFFSAAPSN